VHGKNGVAQPWAQDRNTHFHLLSYSTAVHSLSIKTEPTQMRYVTPPACCTLNDVICEPAENSNRSGIYNSRLHQPYSFTHL